MDEGTAKCIGADAAGTYVSPSYLTSIDTPENKAFISAMQSMFGADLKTPNDLSEPEYEGVYLYKAAVEKATVDRRRRGARGASDGRPSKVPRRHPDERSSITRR